MSSSGAFIPLPVRRIPRRWLDITRISAALQKMVAGTDLATFMADTEGFTDHSVSRARQAVQSHQERLNEEVGGVDQKFLGSLDDPDGTHVGIFFESAMLIEGQATDRLGPYIIGGLYAVISLDVSAPGNDEDPDWRYLAILRWDRQQRIWRLHYENWGLDEGETEDTHGDNEADVVESRNQPGPEEVPDAATILALLRQEMMARGFAYTQGEPCTFDDIGRAFDGATEVFVARLTGNSTATSGPYEVQTTYPDGDQTWHVEPYYATFGNDGLDMVIFRETNAADAEREREYVRYVVVTRNNDTEPGPVNRGTYHAATNTPWYVLRDIMASLP